MKKTKQNDGLHFTSNKLNEVNKQLKIANIMFNDKNEIDGILHALRTIRESFTNIIGPNSIVLFRLELALRGLKDGIQEDFLIPEKNNGRPKTPYNQEIAKAHAAAAITFYIKSGKTKGISASIVMKAIKNWDFNIPSHKINNNTLVNWRKKFLEYRNPESVGQIMYDLLINNFTNQKNGFEDYAAKLIKVAPNSFL